MGAADRELREQIVAWAAAHPEVAARRHLLARLAEALAALSRRGGRSLDAIFRFAGGYVAVNGLAGSLRLVVDPHGPALGGEGEGGEFTLLVGLIADVRRDERHGGAHIFLSSGESVWLGLF